MGHERRACEEDLADDRAQMWELLEIYNFRDLQTRSIEKGPFRGR
jgi:hypothetical protein